MASLSVLMLVMAYKRGSEAFQRQCPEAILIATPVAGDKPIRGTGIIDIGTPDGRGRDPVAHEVVKGGNAANAFAFGVTIGHAEGNDIVLRHPDVSRCPGRGRRFVAAGRSDKLESQEGKMRQQPDLRTACSLLSAFALVGCATSRTVETAMSDGMFLRVDTPTERCDLTVSRQGDKCTIGGDTYAFRRGVLHSSSFLKSQRIPLGTSLPICGVSIHCTEDVVEKVTEK